MWRFFSKVMIVHLLLCSYNLNSYNITALHFNYAHKCIDILTVVGCGERNTMYTEVLFLME